MATQEAHIRTADESDGLATQVQQQVQEKAQGLKSDASDKLRTSLTAVRPPLGISSTRSRRRYAGRRPSSRLTAKDHRQMWPVRRPVRSNALAATSVKVMPTRSSTTSSSLLDVVPGPRVALAPSSDSRHRGF